MVRINPECSELWDKDLINKEFLFNIDSIKRAIDKTAMTTVERVTYRCLFTDGLELRTRLSNSSDAAFTLSSGKDAGIPHTGQARSVSFR